MPNTTQEQTTQDPLKQTSKQGGSYGNLVIDLLSKYSQGLGQVMNMSSLANKTVSQQSLITRNQLSDTMVSTPGFVIPGLGLKAIDTIGDLADFHLDEFNPSAARDIGLSKFASNYNNVVTKIPALGTLSAIFAQRTNKLNNSISDYGINALPSYSSVMNDVNNAKSLQNKRVVFGVNTMNDFINDTSNDINTINKIGKVNTLAKNSDYNTNIAQQTLNRYAGTNYLTHAVGKKGMKLMSRAELQKILATRKFQNGGVIGIDSSILPEGALHARLNHLQDVNPELEDTTRKGIPVLDGNGDQVAEIENSELILRLEITSKIEELMKDGSEEAMIEAGKILVEEIIDNTQDNTGKITDDGK